MIQVNHTYRQQWLAYINVVTLYVELDGFNKVQNHCSVHQCILLPQ